jgi:hypothetical protein
VKKGELAGLSMAGYAARAAGPGPIGKEEGEGFLAKMEELLARLLKGAEDKGSGDKEGNKEAKPEDSGTEEIAKIAKALESVPALVEAMSKIDERLKVIETATPGKMSKGVDESDADDGVSFV